MLLTLSLTLALPVGQASATDMAHQVTNVGDKSFTVTWVTNVAETGYVNYGTSPDSLDNTAYDDRGQTTGDETHHVTVIGLTASTTYYYEIVPDDITDNNGGAPYETTTGPSLEFTMPEMISGKVYRTDGVTAAEGSIIYASIGTSQVLSVLVDSSGTWGLNIAPIRAADYQSYHTYSDSDSVSLEVQGSTDGTITQVVPITAAKTGAPDMILAVTVKEVALSPPPPTPTAFVTSDLSVTPEKVDIEQTVEEAAPEPAQEMNWWLIGGILAGVIVLVTTIWLTINKYRY